MLSLWRSICAQMEEPGLSEILRGTDFLEQNLGVSYAD